MKSDVGCVQVLWRHGGPTEHVRRAALRPSRPMKNGLPRSKSSGPWEKGHFRRSITQRISSPLVRCDPGALVLLEDSTPDTSSANGSAEHVALKVMTKSGWDAKTHLLTSKEVSIMLQMRHPNVVCLFQTLETPARLALVLEYAAGGCLADVLRAHGALAEPCARLLLRQVASGLQHMHAGGVAHRDLKPDNVFLTHLGVPKVGVPASDRRPVRPQPCAQPT